MHLSVPIEAGEILLSKLLGRCYYRLLLFMFVAPEVTISVCQTNETRMRQFLCEKREVELNDLGAA